MGPERLIGAGCRYVFFRHAADRRFGLTVARNLPLIARTLRRARVYGGRAMRTLLASPPRHRSVFLHMPKCGGTSISEAMYATVPFASRVAVIDAVSTRRAAAMLAFGQDDPRLCHEDLPDGARVFDLREAMLLQHMAWDSWLIHGHVLYSARAEAHFAERYKYVTLLRDPVARMISNMRMAQRAGIVGQDIDSYLDSPVAVSHAQVYLRYLSGLNVVPLQDVQANIALAKARLARFAVIGFLDDLQGFQAKYRQVFGVSLSIGRYNEGSGGAPDLTPPQMHRMSALCAPDQEIYAAARAL